MIGIRSRPRFFDYASAIAWLTGLGSSSREVAELYNRSTRAVIGRWAWVDGVIRPIGPIDFTAVTATQGATIASVTGQVLDLSSSTFVVTGGYTLRIRNITDGANVADVAAGSWARSGAGIAAGAAVAAAVAALIAGGKSIRCWVEGLSELSIGGAASAIELESGAAASFVAGGQSVSGGAAIQLYARRYGIAFLLARVDSYTALSNNQFTGVGWRKNAAVSLYFGAGKLDGTGERSGYVENGGAPVLATNDLSACEYVYLSVARADEGLLYTHIGGVSSSKYISPQRSTIAADYAAAPLALYSHAGAVFSILES